MPAAPIACFSCGMDALDVELMAGVACILDPFCCEVPAPEEVKTNA